MAYVPTITYNKLEEGDLLFYRGDSLFSFFIRVGEVIRYGNLKHFFIAFTHVGQVVYNRELDCLERYDSMEGYTTDFRSAIGNAYVFRFKEPLTARELMLWREYLLARRHTLYDRQGAASTVSKKESENPFKDYCSEISKNALVHIKRIKDKINVTPYVLYFLLRKKITFLGVMV